MRGWRLAGTHNEALRELVRLVTQYEISHLARKGAELLRRRASTRSAGCDEEGHAT